MAPVLVLCFVFDSPCDGLDKKLSARDVSICVKLRQKARTQNFGATPSNSSGMRAINSRSVDWPILCGAQERMQSSNSQLHQEFKFRVVLLRFVSFRVNSRYHHFPDLGSPKKKMPS